jgi:hypothetical protein
LKLNLYHFSKIKSQIVGFSYYFCLMIEGSGSVPRTNASGSAHNTVFHIISLPTVVVNPEQFILDSDPQHQTLPTVVIHKNTYFCPGAAQELG